MTIGGVTQPEGDPEGQANEGQNLNNDADNGGGHPAWQSILDAVPDSLHSIIRPELENWDKGVDAKIQDIRSQYDPYKDFVNEKIDPQLLHQALGLVHELNENPESVIQQAIEAFGLDYAKAQVEDPGDDPDDFLGNEDLLNDPRYKALQETVDQLKGRFEEEDQTKEQQKKNEAFETTLKDLETNHGSFDKMYVTALMSQGVDGAEAVKQYHTTVNQAAAQLAGQQQQTLGEPPIVMGAAGNTGSGVPENPVKMGGLKSSDVNQLVIEMLNRNE